MDTILNPTFFFFFNVVHHEPICVSTELGSFLIYLPKRVIWKEAQWISHTSQLMQKHHQPWATWYIQEEGKL